MLSCEENTKHYIVAAFKTLTLSVMMEDRVSFCSVLLHCFCTLRMEVWWPCFWGISLANLVTVYFFFREGSLGPTAHCTAGLDSLHSYVSVFPDLSGSVNYWLV